MLVGIKVRNVGSIKEEVALDLSKGRYGYKEHMIYNDNYVNPIGIFGMNGSGKTILLRALNGVSSIMNNNDIGVFPNLELVDELTNLKIENNAKISELNETNGLLSGNLEEVNLSGTELTKYQNIIDEQVMINEKKNSCIQLSLILDTFEVRYEAVIYVENIVSERIYIDGELILDRYHDNYKVIKHKKFDSLPKEYYTEKDIESGYSAVRDIGTYNWNDEKSPHYILKKVYEYLSNITYISVRGDVDGKIVESKTIETIMCDKTAEVSKVMKSYGQFPIFDIYQKEADNPAEKSQMFFSKNGIEIPMGFISSGMKGHTVLLSTILSLPKGSLLVIDEIERSLHPLVSKELIRNINKHFDVQIIFSTHNSNLLQELRPDQIFFSKWDSSSSTSVYEKLSDTHPNIREVNNIEKLYLGGHLD